VGLPCDTFLSPTDQSGALQDSGLGGAAVGRAGSWVAAGTIIGGSGDGFGDGGGGGAGVGAGDVAGLMVQGGALPGAFAPAQQQLDSEVEPHGPGVAASAATLTAA
jgi:hypothetical protein